MGGAGMYIGAGIQAVYPTPVYTCLWPVER